MTRKIALLLFLLLLLPIVAIAEDYLDVYAGRDSEGNKKYIKWLTDDSIKVSVGFSNSGEVSKGLYRCLEKYNAVDWSTATLVNVDYDEPGEVFLKVKLKYAFKTTYLRATLFDDGRFTCHGINDRD